MRRFLSVVFISLSVCSSLVAQSDPSRAAFAKVDNGVYSLLHSNGTWSQLKKTTAPGIYNIVVYSSDVQAALALGVQVNTIEHGFFTARATLDQITGLSNSAGVRFISLAKKRKPLLDKSVPEIRANILQNGQYNGTSYTGKGVIIGFIDTGIDWKNLDFRSDADTTKSRILWIWDQTISGTNPSGYTYGAEYSQAQIDNELDGTPANVVLEKDDDGHGTHVAGIAAGDGSSSVSGYKGVAPEADIIAVKTTFFDTGIIDGISYIRQKADAAGEPFVINLSLGSQDGAHDGTEADEVAIDQEVSTPGRAVAVAAGNDGSNAIHADSVVAQGGSISYQFSIPTYTPTSGIDNDDVWFDVWYKAGDHLTVSITSPNGATATALWDGQTSVETSTNDGHIQILNAPSGPSPLDTLNDCSIAIYDNVATKPPRAGTWTLKIAGASVTEGGAFDVWLSETEITGNDGSSPVFTTGYSFRKLVGPPATSKEAIAVGSYVTRFTWNSVDGHTYRFASTDRTGNYSTFSSMGPTRDGRQKPEICAPGEVIASSYSEDSSPDEATIVQDGKHVVMEGTSMAAPHIAGVLALLLEAKPTSTSDQLRNAVISSARRDTFTGADISPRWGYGKVDAAGSMGTILAVRGAAQSLPRQFSLMQNYPNPFNPSTTFQFSIGRAQFVTLKIFNILGQEVATLVNEKLQPGDYSKTWDAAGFGSGVYFCRMNVGSFSETKKLVLVK
ncbi:MAG TPA: S8 family serine peptidase [Bacteroidota bacterium]|nr:S8 family serine peptidase [Bacteroidota bacterium]